VLCSHNCALRVDVEANRIVKVRPDANSPMTHGYSCNKAYTLGHYVEHAQRTREPLRRDADGRLRPIPWALAIGEIGARLAHLRAAHGGASIALVGVGGQGNHLGAPYALPFLLGLGSPWWFNSLAQEKTQHALVDRWLFAASPTVFLHADAERSRYVLMLGTNPAVSHRGRNATELLRALAADSTRTLVVVDPRRTETARRADQFVQVRAGGDVYLLLGMAAHIIRAGLVDRAFLARHTRDFGALEAALADVDPAAMAGRAGISPEQLVAVAEGFARAESASVFSDLGIEQTPFSTLIAYLVRVLLLLTGNVGNPGGNVFHGTFAAATPAAQRRRARATVSGIEAIEILSPVGMFSPNLLAEEITAPHDRHIRAVVCEGANPMIQAADTGALAAAFDRLELLVVIDPALSETAERAHYVLPTPVGYEKWEYAGFPKHYPEVFAQLRPPVVRGPAGALPEAEIYARLARTSGIVGAAPRPLAALARRARSPGGAAAFLGALGTLALARGGGREAIASRALLWAYEALGPTLPAPALTAIWLQCHAYALTRRAEVLRARPDLARLPRFALGEVLFGELLAHPEGTVVGALDREQNLADHVRHPDGRVHLSPAPMLAEIRRAVAEAAIDVGDRRFPLILNGGHRTHWNANTIQRDPAWRRGQGPHCALWMHPDDASRVGLGNGDLARLETSRGHAELPVHVDDSLRPGHVAVPNGFGLRYPDARSGALVRTGVAVNELTDAKDRDPFTGCPHHKLVRCRVERADARPAGTA
jgi:anaerobic selenocysteine-containing dehydrogenase